MSKKKLKILSIDGGGTRGIIPATILNCIFEETGKSPVEFFDIFAGTSTGGIIVLSLGVGRKTYEIMELYLNGAKDIFKDNKIDDIRDMGNLIGAQYSQDKLRELLEEAYQNQTMGDLNDRYDGKKHFMIPTFCLNPTDSKGRTHNFRPEIFNSYYIKCNNENLVDVALRSSAAPTYFPMYQNYVDGGVAINHPAMAAVSYAINHHQSKKKSYCYHAPKKKGLERELKDVKVLSLGCGTSNGNFIPEEKIQTGDWGLFQWKDFLADMLVETNISSSEYYVKQVLAPKNYLRCQLYFDIPETPDELRGKKIPMDVTSKKKLKAMKKYAISYFEENKKKIMDFITED